MNAEIIAVGTELLLGQIVNTNARFLSKGLAGLGINVFYHTAVGDNPKRLKQAIGIAQKRSDFILLTGGLGPTKDDLTKETLAELLEVNLYLHEPSYENIKAYFYKMGRPITENNKKQAFILEGAEILPNDTGQAPGMVMTKDEKMYMLLPGPPSELEPMFLKYGKPLLLKRLKIENKIESRILRFFGIGEAALETKLEDLIVKQTNPTIAPLASEGEVTIRLTASGTSAAERTRLLNSLEMKIMSRTGEFFYGYNDTTIIKEMGALLSEKKITLSAAESLTGGLFQEEVTKIPGASKWFNGGVVSYSNEVKNSLLKVKKETLETFGAVSPECAKEMAENVKNLTESHIGISFTGAAGPDPLEGKEPGTVYIGISIDGNPAEAFLFHFHGNRDSIRQRSVKNGAWLILSKLSAK